MDEMRDVALFGLRVSLEVQLYLHTVSLAVKHLLPY